MTTNPVRARTTLALWWATAWPWLVLVLGVLAVVTGGILFTPA